MISKFYLDKEKDIIVRLSKSKEDEITYTLETPNHNTGNLITNLAKICKLETIKNEKDMKIITGKIPASINSDNEEVYIFRLGGIKIANIYENRIEIKAKNRFTYTYECKSISRLFNCTWNCTSNKIFVILYKKIKLKNEFRTRRKNI